MPHRFRRVPFSGAHLQIAEIGQYYIDTAASVRSYFVPHNIARFTGYTVAEVNDEMHQVLSEHGKTTSMSVLAAVEAMFRIDFLQLAHGRYWTPKLGRKYDFDQIYALAESIHQRFPFELS